MKGLVLYIIGILFISSFLASCEEKGLLVNANNVSYISFEKNMMTDTTGVSFKFYNEGEDATIYLGVTVSGKVQDKDLEFTISIDPSRTTLPASQYELPQRCVIKAGELTGEIPVTLKYYNKLDKEAQLLILKIDENEEVNQGIFAYTRAIISVSNLLFAPEWWTRNDGDVDNPYNSVEEWYLGTYSEKKYLMFLEELKKDGVVFDGKDITILRKYSLRLKNTLKDCEERGETVYEDDEKKIPMVVKVAG